MTLRRGIQTAVIKTNEVWPFSYINRAAYGVAIRAFLNICKRFPQIRSVYLRHGMLRNDWIPGVSDIDLTVVFDPGSTAELEFAFLSGFWKEYGRLQKYFPMLGEADVVREEFLSSWTKFGICGYESASWKLIYGTESRNSDNGMDPERLLIDSFHYALLYFFDFFLPGLYGSDASELATIRIRRLHSKILRYTFYNDPAPRREIPATKSEMLFSLLEAFEERLESFSTRSGVSPCLQLEFLPPIVAQNHANELVPFTSQIETCYFSRYNKIVILYNPNKNDFVVEAIRNWANGLEARPRIVTRRLFDYLVRFYDPFLYSDLMRGRRLVLGNDLLPQVESPSPNAILRVMLEQVPLILTFFARRLLITCSLSEWYSGCAVESLLDRALALRLFLEQKILLGSYAEYRAHTEESYPEYYQRFRNASLHASTVSLGETRFEIFRLLRTAAQEIHAIGFTAETQRPYRIS